MEIENQVEAGEEFQAETVEQQEDPTLAKLREIEEKAAELAKRERDLNKGFMEIAERERRLQDSSKTVEEDDDIPALQPEAEKVLDKYVDKKISPILQAQQELYTETVNDELTRTAKQYGISEEDIVGAIDTVGLAPKDNSLKAAREVITAAAEIVKAKRIDEGAIEKRIREQVLKELAESGATIEGVRPSRETPTNTNVNIDEMTDAQRYAYYKSQENQ